MHVLMMKINFKQRTIEDKIKVYKSIIASWVKIRNQLKIVLFSEDIQLTKDINELNEKFYRRNWHLLSLEAKNTQIEQLKTEVIKPHYPTYETTLKKVQY